MASLHGRHRRLHHRLGALHSLREPSSLLRCDTTLLQPRSKVVALLHSGLRGSQHPALFTILWKAQRIRQHQRLLQLRHQRQQLRLHGVRSVLVEGRQRRVCLLQMVVPPIQAVGERKCGVAERQAVIARRELAVTPRGQHGVPQLAHVLILCHRRVELVLPLRALGVAVSGPRACSSALQRLHRRRHLAIHRLLAVVAVEHHRGCDGGATVTHRSARRSRCREELRHTLLGVVASLCGLGHRPGLHQLLHGRLRCTQRPVRGLVFLRAGSSGLWLRGRRQATSFTAGLAAHLAGLLGRSLGHDRRRRSAASVGVVLAVEGDEPLQLCLQRVRVCDGVVIVGSLPG